MRSTNRLTFLTLVAGALLGAAACSDNATAPHTASRDPQPPTIAAPAGAPVFATNTVVGDTIISTFELSGTKETKWVFLGGSHKLVFGAGLNSVCDPATSSYGVGTWDSPCAPATQPITITAKIWTTVTGKPQIDFSPSLRFMPTADPSAQVVLYMKSAAAATSPFGARLNWCVTVTSACVDESLTDSNLRSSYDSSNGYVYRRVKHFSGYIVAE